ncbi:CehA/McbA family metallohydrolase [Rhodoligotrophos defluvii]|uniref:CehA/McbA family metallohydrolase n=1 Tax=Rhodoligotrophos defluvii TaxID=2561934 RepID=UPI0010C9AC0F|nr:CehA/McbA family metallohydrolase [Rhodoligotrophos defluvii]
MSSFEFFSDAGRFLRGNLHTHTTRSDGALPVEAVIAAYRDAGYDFLAITDHFLARYEWPVTDTRGFRDQRFTTLIGAELHAPRTALSPLWHIVAVGLPLDFAPATEDEDGPALARRAREAGAFIGIAHPAWYSLSLEDAETIDAAHAVEIYNHGCQLMHDKGDGAYLLDGLSDKGRRLLTYACDDAHFKAPDFAGGWVEVKAAHNEPDAILDALKAGRFYSSQGPRIHDIAVTDSVVEVACLPAMGVVVVGEGYLMSYRFGTGLTRATLPLEPLAVSPWLRVVVIGGDGRRAWSNPIWKDQL